MLKITVLFYFQLGDVSYCTEKMGFSDFSAVFTKNVTIIYLNPVSVTLLHSKLDLLKYYSY